MKNYVFLNKAQRRPQVNESGNVLFLILIAVALFAFLSYVGAQSTRSTSGMGSAENVSMRASQIIQFATYTEQAILRMRFRDVPDEAFCFDDDNWGHNDYYHSGCDTVKHRVFSNAPEGGNIPWRTPPEGANDGSPWYFPADICIAGLGKSVDMNCDSDSTGDSEDLVMILPNLDLDICLSINKQLDIANPGGLPPQIGGTMYAAGMPKFTGTYSDGGVINSNGDDPSILRNQQEGCVEGNVSPPAGTYHYFHILLPR